MIAITLTRNDISKRSTVSLKELLGITPGVTCVIGSGGKTSLLAALANELREDPGTTVILTTSTHILPFPAMPYLNGEDPAAAALNESQVICLGTPAENGKLTAPAIPFDQLALLATYVLVEADGSRRLPLKAHAAHEPVIPPGTNQTILVVGASGFNHPVEQVVHRPGIFCDLANCAPSDLATPQRVAAAITAEHFSPKVLVNQVDTPQDAEAARELASYMDVSVFAGSLRDPASFRTLR